MKLHVLEREQRVARPLAEVFEFFARANNLERITPPWLSFALVGEEPSELRRGTLLQYRLRVHRVPLRWVAEIELWEPGRAFVDRQVHGPYRLWRHQHDFAPIGEQTIVRDRVRYALPLGRVGDLAHQGFVRRDPRADLRVPPPSGLSTAPMISLLWLRRDLRVHDQQAGLLMRERSG
ncbi:MAG: SRPBCC family protein [Solirubrobacteraceae bacterium]